jgi:dUTP pyrophosphatase
MAPAVGCALRTPRNWRDLTVPARRVALPAVPIPSPEVLVTRLDSELPLPSYAHPGDAGADLVAATDVELAPGQRAIVSTGIAIALPEGFAAFVHPRSGLAARCGVTLMNSPGTIDAGYRGEIKLIVVNHDPAEPVTLRRGDRVAQLIVQRVERATFRPVDRLPDSARGSGGYGSTGGHALLLDGTS